MEQCELFYQRIRKEYQQLTQKMEEDNFALVQGEREHKLPEKVFVCLFALGVAVLKIII